MPLVDIHTWYISVCQGASWCVLWLVSAISH